MNKAHPDRAALLSSRGLSALVLLTVAACGSTPRGRASLPEEARRAREGLKNILEYQQHLRAHPEICTVQVRFDNASGERGLPVVLAARIDEWGAPAARPVLDQVFVLDGSSIAKGVSLRLDPCRPVNRWCILAPGRAPGVTFPDQTMSVEHSVRLAWPKTPETGGEGIVYERTGHDMKDSVLVRLVPTADESIVRALLPPQWVGGPLGLMARRGLYEPIRPNDFHNTLLMGPWEGRASQYRHDGPEGLDLTRGSWRVATLCAIGPAIGRPNMLEYRILQLYRIPTSPNEPIELVWTRRYIPLPKARDPTEWFELGSSSIEPKRYEVRDVR